MLALRTVKELLFSPTKPEAGIGGSTGMSTPRHALSCVASRDDIAGRHRDRAPKGDKEEYNSLE